MRAMMFTVAILAICLANTAGAKDSTKVQWKAGVATSNITPEQPMWLAGYTERVMPAEGKLTDLWLKVIALEAADGRLGVVVTSDLLGIPRRMYDRLTRKIQERFGLSHSQVMFTCSHTHSGPVLQDAMIHFYPLDKRQHELIEQYSNNLERKIVSTIAEAIKNLQPATLAATTGETTFAVNRRNNPEENIVQMQEKGTPFVGPVDHSVPVLAVRDSSGKLMAILFGYACHCTTFKASGWFGDYAGLAEAILQKEHPGCVAMFWQGCGADQNPLPRRSLELCHKYGRMLADGVEEALQRPTRAIKPSLKTAFEFVELDFQDVQTREQLEADLKNEAPYLVRRAKWLLEQLDREKEFSKSYQYPVQVWKLGDNQLWVALGGEVSVEYALKVKELFGADAWITGYANDVMAYIPSDQIQEEGGYESAAFNIFGLPAQGWVPGVQQRVIETVQKLASEAGMPEKTPVAIADSEKPVDTPHLVFLITEDRFNYEAHKTIPPFAKMLCEKYGLKCTVLQGEGKPGKARFPNLEILKDADLLIIFFRRRALSPKQLGLIRDYLKAGKPLVGIRTANHAFAVRGEVAEGHQNWLEFVPEVLGCKNRGYGPRKAGADVDVAPDAANHPILKGVSPLKWHSDGQLYLIKPLVDTRAAVLLTGSLEDKVEPVAWTRMNGQSRVFYTSLGYPGDFELEQFRRLLVNAIFWSLDRSPSENKQAGSGQ